MGSLNTACLVPPELDSAVEALKYPPQYDLRSISPPGSRLDVNPFDCTSFPVDVGAIWDNDDDVLLFRWVANNGRSNTQVVRPTDRSSAPAGEPTRAFALVAPQRHFFNEFTLATSGERPTTVGMLSLFITDAPEWALEDVDNADRKTLDLSRIQADGTLDGGAVPYSVIEVRWSVVFSDRLEGCPQ